MRYSFLIKRGLIGFWLAIVILSVAAWPGERAAAQSPELRMCWEDQLNRGPGGRFASFPTNITLVSFCVEYYDADDLVLVTWETGTEIDTAGFYIQRYEQQSGTYPRISDFLYSLSVAPPAGAIYEYEDDTAELGKIYYYKLEEIDINNVSVSLTGPIAFDFYSPTATPTGFFGNARSIPPRREVSRSRRTDGNHLPICRVHHGPLFEIPPKDIRTAHGRRRLPWFRPPFPNRHTGKEEKCPVLFEVTDQKLFSGSEQTGYAPERVVRTHFVMLVFRRHVIRISERSIQVGSRYGTRCVGE